MSIVQFKIKGGELTHIVGKDDLTYEPFVVNPLLSVNVYWSLVQHKYFLAHARRWRVCLLILSDTFASRQACTPHWFRHFCDISVPLITLKSVWCCSWSSHIHNEALINVVCDQRTSFSMPFCDYSSLFLCFNLLMTFCDTKHNGLFHLRTSCLKKCHQLLDDDLVS